MTLNSSTSTYLDLLRITAAMVVFVSHLSWNLLSDGFLWQVQFLGHDGVIVFFVLSGFVISYVADTKEKTYFDFQVARFARLYSVVIPVLVLTVIFDQIGIAQDPSKYVLSRESDPLLRLAASGLFLSQSWGWDLYLFGNDPFWSLPYEFWYYQIFAAVIFLRGWKSFAVIAACLALSGPPIIFYLPLWLMGVAAYHFGKTIKLSSSQARWIFSLSLLCGVALLLGERTLPSRNTALLPPNFSLLDFALGALMAANIFAATFLNLRFGMLAKPIAAAAGISFSLYLLHVPILRMVSAYLPGEWSSALRGVLLFTITLTAVYLLSFVTERRKREWRTLFSRLFSRLKFASTG